MATKLVNNSILLGKTSFADFAKKIIEISNNNKFAAETKMVGIKEIAALDDAMRNNDTEKYMPMISYLIQNGFAKDVEELGKKVSDSWYMLHMIKKLQDNDRIQSQIPPATK